MAANVLAPCALLVEEGGAARFPAPFPPVYLSMQLNFERDGDTGELFSCEVAIREHQEGIREEMARHPVQVKAVLDPRFEDDWLAFFRARFALEKAWEVWKGAAFVGNAAKEPPRRKGYSAFPVFSLRRSTVAEFARDAGGSVREGRGGGCLCVYRTGPPQAEPFGMWLCWLVEGTELVLVDLQNGLVSRGVKEAVEKLHWAEPPREELFFAPFAGRERQ